MSQPPDPVEPSPTLTPETIEAIGTQLESLRAAARRLEREREEAVLRAHRLQFVRELAHRSGGRIPLQDFLKFCVERLCTLMGLEDCAIVLSSPHRLAPDQVAVAGADATGVGSDPLTRQVLQDPRELISDGPHTRWLPGGAGGAPPASGPTVLSLPLMVEDAPFGVLHLARPPSNGKPAFSSADLDTAREIAYEVSLGVDGARRFHEMQQKAHQLERSREEIRSYFNQVGAAMSSALNLNQLLRLIVSLCIRVTQAHGGSLYLIENSRLRQRVVIGSEDEHEAAGKVHLRESLVGWGVDALQEANARVSLSRVVVGTDGTGRRGDIESFLGVPLVIKDEVKGQLNIYTRDARDFRPEEVSLLTTFARQAALAIENAQIFEFESQRAREATLLYKAARAIALCADLDEVLDISVHQLLRITNADRCLIFLAQERRGDFRLARSVGLSPDQDEFFSVYRLRTSQVAADLWDTLSSGRQVYLTSPPTNCPALARLFELLPTHACLMVPLLAKEKVLGLIMLDDSRMTRYFDESQVRMVMTLAIQIATAVQRARLMAELADNLEQVRALHQVSTAVAGTLSLPRVLDLVMEKSCELLGNPSCTLLVNENEELRLQGARGVPEGLCVPEMQQLIASVAVERKRPSTFYLAAELGAGDEGGGVLRVAKALQEARLGGVVAVPLIARRKIVGVLNCFAQPDRHFTVQEIRLIRAFANQAAAALENARLHEVVRNKMHELGVLFEIGKTITSTLNLPRVLQAVADNVHNVMNADALAIMLLDPVQRQLTIATSIGLGPHHASRTVRLGRGIAGVAAKTGRPMIMVDEEGAARKDRFPESVRRDGLRTILSVPMWARGKIVGLINVYYKRVHYHQPDEVNLLVTLSSQAAIAIENASLYHEKNQVSEMLRNMLLPRETFQHPRIEVGHRFISSFELSGDYYDMAGLDDDRAAFCMADVAGKGPRAAMYAARAKYVLRSYTLAGYAPREVMTMLNRIIAPETEPEMFITLFCGEVDLKKQVLTYASAGHEPPILWRPSDGRCRLLNPRDIMVGVDKDYAYKQRRVPIHPGDLLVLYTDGVTEARGAGQEGFGLDRLQRIIREHHTLPAQALANRITAAVMRYARKKLNDDFSLMVVRLR